MGAKWKESVLQQLGFKQAFSCFLFLGHRMQSSLILKPACSKCFFFSLGRRMQSKEKENISSYCVVTSTLMTSVHWISNFHLFCSFYRTIFHILLLVASPQNSILVSTFQISYSPIHFHNTFLNSRLLHWHTFKMYGWQKRLDFSLECQWSISI